MLTRRLWLRLSFPPEWHPLYQRIVRTHAETIPWYIWVLAVIFFPVLVLPAIFFTAMAYSVLWTVNISGAINREQQLGTYELMSATPPGELGINWIISTGSLHRNFSFERLHSGGLWFVRIAIGIVLVSTINDASTPSSAAAESTSLMRFMVYVAVALGLVADHYQSVVMGSLIGMLAPTYVRDVVLLRLIAPGLMLFIQIASYLIIWLLAFAVLPRAFDLLAFKGAAIAYVLVVLQLLIFVLVREGIVFALWRTLVQRLQATPSDAVHVLDWLATWQL